MESAEERRALVFEPRRGLSGEAMAVIVVLISLAVMAVVTLASHAVVGWAL